MSSILSRLKKSSFPLCAAIGEGCALALTALLLLPAAWAVSAGLLPETAGRIAACVPAGLAVLVTTAVIVRVRGREALATGGAIALGAVLLAALCCALGGAKSAFGPWLAWLAGAAAAGGLAGALAGIRRNSHKKRRR